ncbi:ABC transporter substrate-binding protein [Psychrobacter sp. HD31]|uniref:ABC transporter substrate-binding protein n=1 Tax=Psychrobacter sp. HD31 TaxID=3112003 RepID=UPI003DA3E415
MSQTSPFFKLLTPTALALSLAALTACGGDKPADKDTHAAAATSGEMAESQELTINNGAEPESLDPHKISGVPESNIIRQIMVGLTSTDPDGNTMPGMAESWESADNKVWTFKLRDANWSNGDPVTAEDFVYSLQRVLTPETASPYASYLADAKVVNAQDIIDGKAEPSTLGVKAIDEKTLEITLSEPVPYFPDVMIHTSVKPVHKATVEQFGDKWTNPENIVVNGAYTVNEWNVNDKIVLTRNEAYFDNANTKINKVTVLPISENTSDVARYKAGEIDMTYNELPPEQFTKLQEEFGDEVHVSPFLCTYYYEFNTVKPPFDDVRVRRALALALDRNTITDKVLAQGQTPAYQFTPPATQGSVNNSPEWEALDQAARVEQAKKLLTEAGYNESNPLKFELLYNTNENHKKIAVAASALWKQALGDNMINVTLTNQEWKTYLDTRRNGNYDVSRAGWCGDYNEASTFLNIVKTGNSNNHGKYSSQNFDSLMNQTLKAGVDNAKRSELYNQAEAQLDADMPLIQIYHYISPRMIKPYVNGFTGKDALDNWQFKDFSIAKH